MKVPFEIKKKYGDTIIYIYISSALVKKIFRNNSFIGTEA